MIAEGNSPSDVERAFQDVVASGAASLVRRVELRFSSLLLPNRGIATQISFEELGAIEGPQFAVNSAGAAGTTCSTLARDPVLPPKVRLLLCRTSPRRTG
jgi:hypothetical protein